MNKYEFKNFNGFISVDDYNTAQEEIKVYDEFGKIFDIHFKDEWTSQEDLDNYFCRLTTESEDIFNFIDRLEFLEGYNYGHSLQDLIDTWNDDNYNCAESEDLAEEFSKEYENDLKNLTEEEFCEHYEINKIGDYFIQFV